MSASDIKPEIWVMIDGKNERPFLVCGARFFRGEQERKSENSVSYKFIAHAVAIDLTNASICSVRDSTHDWHRQPVEDHGLTQHTAQAALDQAFRLYDVDYDWKSKDVEIKYHSKRASYKNKSALWKCLAMIEWNKWTKKNVSMIDRVSELHSHGFATVTAKALTRTAEEYGL